MRLDVAWLSALALLVGACGARTALDERVDGASAPAEPCELLATSVCDRALQCSPTTVTRGAGWGRSFRDRAECVARVALGCRTWARTPDAAWSASIAAECAARWQRARCAVAVADFDDELLGCGQRAGSRANGAACASSLQCASGLCLLRDGACGACAARPGRPPPTEVGGPCARGGFCSGQQQCVDNVCRDRAVEGEACGECVATGHLRCESGRCVATPTASEGQRCGNVDGPSTPQPPVCASGSDCVGRNDFGAGRCVAFAPEGAACEVRGGVGPCQFPARCVEGRCALVSDACR